MNTGFRFVWILLLIHSLVAADERLPRIAPTEPQAAASTFVIRDGFEMQLLAAEPLVTDPVAMQYDEWGRAWVAEMRDYPYTDAAADKPFTEKTADLPLGRIRILEDTNNDGAFDQSTVFAENLSWPTGLALWKGGIFVVATPDLWYLKDTDDDGKADLRERVMTGFRKFNVQAVINNLKWGIDHRLYGAGSSNGGRLVPGDEPDNPPLVMAAGDFRFRPDQVFESFELLSGGARFGNTFDDWGHRFICNIRNPIQQIVLPRQALARNPLAEFRSAVHDVAASGDTVPVWRRSPPEPWRVMNARRLANDPSVASPRSEAVAAGYMTSASGVTIYRGDAYPTELYGTVFLGEVAGNLIHHQRLFREGVAFQSVRTSDESEFLASTDNWFRPVNFVNAPDGTLHVLDMYRETIEHPWSIPDDIKAQVDLESGRDRGRIWRLAPVGFQPPARPNLAEATTAQLVEHLASPRSWFRETAHRLLFERQDPAAVPLLRNLLRRGSAAKTGEATSATQDVTQPDPQAAARLLALWSLEGLQSLDTEDILTALEDAHPGVRRQAIELAESRLNEDVALRERLPGMAGDTDIEVRFQLALSLSALDTTGSSPDPVIQALARIGHRDAHDPFARAAVLSAVTPFPVPVLQKLMELDTAASASPSPEQQSDSGEGAHPLIRDLAFMVGARGEQAETNAMYEVVMSPHVQNREASILPAMALGFAQGLQRRRMQVLTVLEESQHPGAVRLAAVFSDAARGVADAGPDASAGNLQTLARTAELLRFADAAAIRPLLVPWLESGSAAEVQVAAVRVLAAHPDDEVAELLIRGWRSLRPPARVEAMETLLSRPQWHGALLSAVEGGIIAAFEIPHLRRNLLLRSRDEKIKERAVQLFSATLSARRDIVDRYRREVSPLQADRARGEVVYKRECQSCHRSGTAGQELGPNLATIRHRAPDEVLLHILDPNREVAPNYIAQVVITDEGQVLTGLITEETPHQITMKLSTGVETQLPRSKVMEISSTGQSLMPVGFEQRITAQEMADLLAFLLR